MCDHQSIKGWLRAALFVFGLLLYQPAALANKTIPASQAQMDLSFAPVARQAAPAVVNIYTKRTVVDRAVSPFSGDPFFNQFFGERFGMFGMPRERVVSSLGSGVVVDGKGLVITNYHVINEAQDITVVLNDRREFSARIVLRDEQSDLVLLQMEAVEGEIVHLPLRDSDELEVGDLVLAIGNPFGVGQTVTSGIVSATARSAAGVSDFGFFIQTDAAINPGNSGGALVDMQGRLVGVPTAIYTRSGGSNGIGFAIPANMVRAMLGGQTQNGRVVKPWLGAKYQNVTRKLAESLGLDRAGGVLVSEVYDDSPADDAGLKAGDVIVRFDGKPVADMQALRFRSAIMQIGAKTTLEIIRDGRARELEMEMMAPPDTPARDERTLKGEHPLNGLSVANLNPALAVELGIDPGDLGVIITRGRGSIQPGDRILAINGTAIESTRQLERLLRSIKGGWRIDFERGGQCISLRVVQ